MWPSHAGYWHAGGKLKVHNNQILKNANDEYSNSRERELRIIFIKLARKGEREESWIEATSTFSASVRCWNLITFLSSFFLWKVSLLLLSLLAHIANIEDELLAAWCAEGGKLFCRKKLFSKKEELVGTKRDIENEFKKLTKPSRPFPQSPRVWEKYLREIKMWNF